MIGRVSWTRVLPAGVALGLTIVVVGVIVASGVGATSVGHADGDEPRPTGLERADVTVPTANFTYSPSNPAVGETVTFDASGSSDPNYDIVEYRWDFGADGDFENVTDTPTVEHTFDAAGTYDVRLVVVNQIDETDTVIRDVTVGNEPPEASFSVDPRPAVAGEPTTLDASASSDPDGSIVQYRWDFDGDGVVDNTTTNPVVTHEFAYNASSPGLANVVLTVVDDDGATGTAFQDLNVVKDVIARCSVDPEETVAGGEVTIDASASENASAYQYDVDGDGEYETDLLTEPSISRPYDSAGTYTPRVRVYGPNRERTDTAPCGDVVVRPPNEPPEASFSVSPQPAVATEPTTLDARASSDPDGTIQYYLWDFDGDGTVDLNTTEQIVTHEFPYDASSPGLANVVLTVVDDDGARTTITRDVNVRRPEVTARCSALPDRVAPGEQVVIDASDSINGVSYEYDVDGDGTFDREVRGESTVRVSFDETGNYTPSVRVSGIDGARTDTARCGRIAVRDPSEPPVASLDYSPSTPSPGDSTTLDASASADPDGDVVEYRWDFDDDGTIDRVTNGPVVDHTFESAGNHTVSVVVVGEDGATDRAQVTVRVESGSVWDSLPGPPWLIPGLVGGGGAGYIACRSRDFDVHRVPNPFGGSRGSAANGIAAHATGTLETPPSGESVTVGGLGFEPDVILFSATDGDAGTVPCSDRTDGWTYGKVMRNRDGSISQTAVAVADDARRGDAGAATVRDDAAIDLLSYGDDRVGELVGSVEATTADGFEMGFEASGVPDDRDAGHVVMFQALAMPGDTDVAVGHAQVPDDPGTQSIPIGFDADAAVLTATTATTVNELDAADDVVAVSHGEAVTGEHGTTQRVVTSSVDPEQVAGNTHAASTERAVHLLGDESGDRGPGTKARVTGLDGALRLEYDEVKAGGIVTVLAVDTGEAGRPAVGDFDLPGTSGDESVTIDVGFEPAIVEFVGCGLGSVDGSRTLAGSPLPFGWSHGSAMATDGVIAQHMLHGTFDAADPAVERPTASPDGDTSSGQSVEDAEGREGTKSHDSPAYVGSSDATAAVLAIGPEGGIVGRDEVRVTGTTPTGFEVEVTDVSTRERNGNGERRRVVFYKAWPAPGRGR